MAEIDKKVLQSVTKEWMGGAGIGLTVRTALGMLQRLEQAYGDDFSIESACEALSSLARDAENIKGNLEQELRKAQE